MPDYVIFTRPWWLDLSETKPAAGRQRCVAWCQSESEARLICRDMGETESGWRYQPGKGWRGPYGKAYEYRAWERADNNRNLTRFRPWQSLSTYAASYSGESWCDDRPAVSLATYLDSFTAGHYPPFVAHIAGQYWQGLPVWRWNGTAYVRTKRRAILDSVTGLAPA